jgi:molybdopterin/thiamine biosynthesis adenylyltransferase
MKVTIIGVGALGSHLVSALRNEKVTLRIIDFDKVEMKNVSSQFHFKGGVGKKKVEALKQAMAFCFGLPLEVVGNKLTADNVEQLLGGADLLIDCLDNGESRKLVQLYARANKVPCLHGALAAGGIMGRVVWDERFNIDYGTAGAPTCEDGEFLPFIQITSAWLAFAAQNFIRDGRKVGYSISHGGVEKI